MEDLNQALKHMQDGNKRMLHLVGKPFNAKTTTISELRGKGDHLAAEADKLRCHALQLNRAADNLLNKAIELWAKAEAMANDK